MVARGKLRHLAQGWMDAINRGFDYIMSNILVECFESRFPCVNKSQLSKRPIHGIIPSSRLGDGVVAEGRLVALQQRLHTAYIFNSHVDIAGW
jgi:hypothetical protein